MARTKWERQGGEINASLYNQPNSEYTGNMIKHYLFSEGIKRLQQSCMQSIMSWSIHEDNQPLPLPSVLKKSLDYLSLSPSLFIFIYTEKHTHTHTSTSHHHHLQVKEKHPKMSSDGQKFANLILFSPDYQQKSTSCMTSLVLLITK